MPKWPKLASTTLALVALLVVTCMADAEPITAAAIKVSDGDPTLALVQTMWLSNLLG
jgi:hypothetical protein